MSDRRALHVVLALLALLLAAGLWRVCAAVGLEVPLDPNEGWNAYHAAAAMGGGPLYPGPHSYMINNYPPLSFYFVGGIGLLVGDNIIAGRIVSLVSLGALAVGLYLAARRMGCRRDVSALPPLLFAGGLLLFTDYVGMNDPQMLAEAVAVAGFAILLSEPRTPWTVAGAAALFALAVFVKHNVVALALAASVWLLLHDRRGALRLVACGLGLFLAGLMIFRLVYGTGLLAQIVTARSYSLDNLIGGVSRWLRWSLIPLVGLAALAVRYRRDRYVQLCAVTATIGTLIGVALLGGTGVDPNVLFDADIALALAAALLIERLGGRRAAAAAAYAAPLLFAAATNADWRDGASWRHPMRDEAAMARDDIAFLARRPGPAICEMPSFCYWANKPAAVDVFNIGQAFETGARSDAELTRQIEARRFAAIQFDPDSPYSLGDNVHNAVARAYRLDHADDYGAFYVRK